MQKTHYIDPAFSRECINYTPALTDVATWLARPESSEEDPSLAALLAQLANEGLVTVGPREVCLSWADAYALLDDPEYANDVALLGLPPVVPLRPVLSSRGSLSDPGFVIALSGWLDATGKMLKPSPTLTGPVASSLELDGMLRRAAWEVLVALAAFHARTPAERTHDSNRQHWSRLRTLALAADAALSDFLNKTIVLTPEQLTLHLEQTALGDDRVVTVSPGFDGAPARWLEIFDRMRRVPDHYDIPDGSHLTQVIVSPQVRSVLTEIKRMPGRRVAGDRAESFVRNPFAMLGPDASAVIDADALDDELGRARVLGQCFTPRVLRGSDGRILGVEINIDPAMADELSTSESIAEPEQLSDFVTRLGERLSRASAVMRWRGHTLELLGDANGHHQLLTQTLDEWVAPDRIESADIFDTQRYSERIEGFGEEPPYYSPFIERKNASGGWFPENIEVLVRVPSDGASSVPHHDLNPGQLAPLRTALQEALQNGEPMVTVPGSSDAPLPVKQVVELLDQVDAEEQRRRRAPADKPYVDDGAATARRIHLKLKANIEHLDYDEGGADALLFPSDARATLPSGLRAEVQLRSHQLVGLAWLQHLWRQSPRQCRGALLADDMGLGKTIQLLSFIASCLETSSELEPVLIVAPVALLENWQEEIDKFFEPGAMATTLLYGQTLAELRVPKAAIDTQLQSQGLTRLLRKGWRGTARIVMTTYETLRDLEFSLAAERWSIMVCDEAQKIKNPGAMVTRAAKKQNVRFRIACTGTPVENTLTDLWCLFDFIQPGLLGSLSAFSKQYRRPIESRDGEECAQIDALRQTISTRLLRRTKHDVAKDLPQKLEQSHRLPISDSQLAHYRDILRTVGQGSDDAGRQLEMIQRLRMVSSDPFAFDSALGERTPVSEHLTHNPKLQWLIDTLRAVQSQQEKAIVFCEFRSLQRTLQRVVGTVFDVHAEIINGDTKASTQHHRSRQKLIRRFQETPGFGVIVLSPIAVGFGVNIQAANHVIHFSRSWNPAKEDQATDRAYRIGQTRDVHVHYPIISSPNFKTFDEKLHELLSWKRDLSRDMLNGTGELRAEDFGNLADLMPEVS